MSVSTVITTISDTRSRPLVILRRSPKDEILYVLMRYHDMTEEDKLIVRTAYDVALSQEVVAGADFGSDVSNIEGFLAFSENRLCG